MAIPIRSSNARILTYQILLGASILGTWEYVGANSKSSLGVRPSEIAARITEWGRHDLYFNVAYTLAEMLIGLAGGVALGVTMGLLLGSSRWLLAVFRPLVVAFYSIPLVAVAPLLIMFFGLGIMPKVVLVIFVVSFIMAFSTLSGAQQVDQDLIATLELMGATRAEQFWNVILPSCMAWIISGLKVALPNSLVAAVTGELLSIRFGLGSLLGRAAGSFDMAGVYAALFLLMMLGMLVAAFAEKLDQFLLRWRHAQT